MRTEIEVTISLYQSAEVELSESYQTRMVHLKPAELLLPYKKMSSPTERMLNHFVQ